MKLGKKRGFTIVELVIVIAVIAILAAILIPTFTGIIGKAKLSKDIQTARQMNLLLYEAELTEGKPSTYKDVLSILKNSGIEAPLYTENREYAFFWRSDINRIMLVKMEDEAFRQVVYPEEFTEIKKMDANTWYSIAPVSQSECAHVHREMKKSGKETHKVFCQICQAELKEEPCVDENHDGFCDFCKTPMENGGESQEGIGGISLNMEKCTMTVGKTATLTVKGKNGTVLTEHLKWSSEHPDIATVDAGKIRALAEGSTKITVIYEKNNEKYETFCLLTVEGKIPDTWALSLEKAALFVEKTVENEVIKGSKGENLTLSPVYTPSDFVPEEGTVSWKSDHPSVVKVEKGVLTALQGGEAMITCTYRSKSGKEMHASCKVTVGEKFLIMDENSFISQMKKVKNGDVVVLQREMTFLKETKKQISINKDLLLDFNGFKLSFNGKYGFETEGNVKFYNGKISSAVGSPAITALSGKLSLYNMEIVVTNGHGIHSKGADLFIKEEGSRKIYSSEKAALMLEGKADRPLNVEIHGANISTKFSNGQTYVIDGTNVNKFVMNGGSVKYLEHAGYLVDMKNYGTAEFHKTLFECAKEDISKQIKDPDFIVDETCID